MNFSEVQQMSMSFKLYAVFVADSILMYDHMATLTEEITFIWCRPKALSAILFLVNRYVALLGNIYVLSVYLLPTSDELSDIFSNQRTALFFPTNLRLPYIDSSHLCSLLP
ncbi:hypothetical protein EDB19DRAFT_1263356 [Suillus lakei]|nr:hypothetical protein EDB19DRAFT_1263356 [Suillus lakei]